MANKKEKYQYLTSSVQKETLDLAPAGAKRVLDLGGGSGVFTKAVARACGAEFAATVDISKDAIDKVESGIDASGVVDLVLCLDVLEHLVDPWRVMANIHALLPEEGMVLASIPNVQNYRILIRALTGTWGYRESGLFDRTHLRFFSQRSAKALMTGTGLKEIDYSRAYGSIGRDRFLARASLGLFNPWMTLQHLILVQKTGGAGIYDPGFCGEAIPYS